MATSDSLRELLAGVAKAHARMIENAAEAFRNSDEGLGRAWALAADSLLDGVRTLGDYFARLVPYAHEGDTLQDVARRARDAGDSEVAAALDRVAALALRAPSGSGGPAVG